MSSRIQKPLEFLVVLHTSLDFSSVTALKKLGERTRGDLSAFATINCDANIGSWVDPVATIYQSGFARHVQLIDWLARNMAQLETVRLVALVASEPGIESHVLIDSSMRKLNDVLLRMSVNLRIKEFRVACPTYSSAIPKKPFFVESANANLVVIARDSSSHRAIARPIDGLQINEYASHIAIELSAIFGMWKEIPCPIVDDLEVIYTGIPEVLVRFVSSRLNLLDCPPLPINKLMSHDGELPIPHQFFSVPDANQAAQKFSNSIYPSELRFNATKPPAGPLVSVDGKKFKKQYLKELFKAFAQTPAALIRGVQDHLRAMSGAALQEAVGGASSSVEVMYPGRNIDMGEASITALQVDSIITDVSERMDRPVISTIGEQSWVQIVEKIMAIADGGAAAIEERKAFSDDKFLLVRQSALSPEVDDLEQLLKDIFEGPSVKTELNEGIVATAIHEKFEITKIVKNEEFAESTEIERDVTTALTKAVEDGIQAESEGSVNVDEELQVAPEIPESDNQLTEVIELVTPIEESDTDIQQEIKVKPERADLLGKITQIMLDEGAAARARAEQMIGYLRELPLKFSATEVGTISSAVKIAVALGFSMLYLTIGSLTSRRNWFNFETIGDKNRSLIWVIVSTLIVFMALAGMVIRDNKEWQGKVIAAATLLVVLLGAEIVFWNNIWKVVTKVERFRVGPLAATLLLVASVVVVSVSITRNRLSDSKVRRQFAGILFVVTWVYVVVGAAAAWGSDSSVWWRSKQHWLESTRTDVFRVSIAVGLTLLIVSGFVVAFTIVRERYKLEELSRYLVWAVDELETSTDAERRLRLAAVQWTGTAAVLARLFRYPLGRSVLVENTAISGQGSDLSALKFEQQNLLLTRKGELGLTARLRQLFISKGWLGRQYNWLIARYQEDMAFEQGVPLADINNMRPESCPAVPNFTEIVNGWARGSRWIFMKNVFSDQYDSVLLKTTNEVQLEAAYSTIVDDAESHSVGNSEIIAPTFFARLVPSEPVRLPNGLVTVLFTANDNRQILKPYVWWPDELLPKPETSQIVNFRESRVLTPEKLTDPIRLLGSCVMLSEAFVLDEVGMGEGLYNQQNDGSDDLGENRSQSPGGDV